METHNVLNDLTEKEFAVYTTDFNEIFNMLQYTDEIDRIEAKEATHGLGKSFLETVSAFANEPDLGGGYILLGVTKNKESSNPRYIITGIADPDNLQQQIATQCSSCFSITIRPTIKIIPHPKGTMILVCIPEAEAHNKPVFIQSKGIEKGSYRRIGSTDQLCMREDFNMLYQLRTRQKHDASAVEDVSIEEFDQQAIQLYRLERAAIKSNAAELRYDDEDLLRALKAITTEKGASYPTVAGLLLFGSHQALRRTFPMRSRIDYLLVEGRDWVADPKRRYTSVEMCEALITGIPNLLYKIMQDIPQVFEMQPDGLRRKDNPLIPRIVIREALVNAVMHKDYHSASPIMVIKYANRIEFRNQGYSLKPTDQLGLPGSMPRNEILANIFRDINYAEGKGTGISTMRDEMRKANLSVPLIESDRASNLFVLSLLPHHLFTKQDLEWLSQFKSYNLTDEEARTLIVIREKGAITNADYRTIHSVDTLTASLRLRKLRDLGFTEQKGRGNATFYVPALKLLVHDISLTTQQKSNANIESTRLPEDLEKEIQKIGKKTSSDTIKQIIKRLCLIRPYKTSELAIILKRAPRHLRDRYLSVLIDSNELELAFPDSRNHPLQTYKTKSDYS